MPINNFLLPGAKFTPAYEVANSCRFNSGDSPKLVKSQTTATNRKKWTWSGWIKAKSTNSADSHVFAFGDSNSQAVCYIGSDQVLRYYEHDGSSASVVLYTNRLLRDPSAWYNIIYAFDSTQSTESDRLKLYINGVQETSFSSTTYPSLNQDSNMGINGEDAKIGTRIDGSGGYFDGYMAEVVLLDGTAATSTSFGEFDEDSPRIFKPIDVSGLTFGNNGFYLDFEDSANLGNDANGGTDLTETNLAAADQATDTPTNNFCTLNPLNNWEGSYTLSEGNCIMTCTGANDATAGTMGVASGKFYYEVEFDSESSATYAGWGPDTLLNNEGTGNPITSFIGMYRDDNTLQIGGSSEGAYTDVSDGDIFGFAINLDAASGSQTVVIQKNGTTIDTVTIPTANEGAFWIPVVGDTTGGNPSGILKCNFGGCPSVAPSSAVADANGYGSFEYNPTISSVDYLALCTKNLAEHG